MSFRWLPARLATDADFYVVSSFWLFGLINNVLYVIILSAALDLVGPDVPKGIVLLADVVPSFLAKLTAPYFIHRVPYAFRVIIFVALSTFGMGLVAATPGYADGGTITTKMFGIVLASLSSGIGELSFLGLTHFYGTWSLAAWSSGTGAAGLVGAGLYSLLTTAMSLHVRTALMASAFLPAVMVVAFFGLLPKPHLEDRVQRLDSHWIRTSDSGDDDVKESARLLAESAADLPILAKSSPPSPTPTFRTKLRRLRRLFLPFMLPLFGVYVAEYTINLSLFPNLLFPLRSTPFSSYSSFYPTYSLLYQVGVFISRSSLPLVRIPPTWLYPLALLQGCNLTILLLQALYNFMSQSIGETGTLYWIFAIIVWEGLLGGSVYVGTFDGIRKQYSGEEREWCLGATTVSDSAGIAVAGVVASIVEKAVCGYQVDNGRDWCTRM